MVGAGIGFQEHLLFFDEKRQIDASFDQHPFNFKAGRNAGEIPNQIAVAMIGRAEKIFRASSPLVDIAFQVERTGKKNQRTSDDFVHIVPIKK